MEADASVGRKVIRPPDAELASESAHVLESGAYPGWTYQRYRSAKTTMKKADMRAIVIQAWREVTFMAVPLACRQHNLTHARIVGPHVPACSGSITRSIARLASLGGAGLRLVLACQLT
jgi:hypothetical protein